MMDLERSARLIILTPSHGLSISADYENDKEQPSASRGLVSFFRPKMNNKESEVLYSLFDSQRQWLSGCWRSFCRGSTMHSRSGDWST